jgi:hypothetical protein
LIVSASFWRSSEVVTPAEANRASVPLSTRARREERSPSPSSVRGTCEATELMPHPCQTAVHKRMFVPGW